MVVNFTLLFGSCINITIVPNIDETMPLQWPQMSLELIQEQFIFVRITEEDFDWHEHLPALHFDLIRFVIVLIIL